MTLFAGEPCTNLPYHPYPYPNNEGQQEKLSRSLLSHQEKSQLTDPLEIGILALVQF